MNEFWTKTWKKIALIFLKLTEENWKLCRAKNSLSCLVVTCPQSEGWQHHGSSFSIQLFSAALCALSRVTSIDSVMLLSLWFTSIPASCSTSYFYTVCQDVARCGGLAVACQTAVRKVLGSNRAVGNCVICKNHCDLQPWAQAVHTLPAVPRSTQPSTLHGMVNDYQLSG